MGLDCYVKCQPALWPVDARTNQSLPYISSFSSALRMTDLSLS